MEPKIHDKILLNELPAKNTKIAKDNYRGAGGRCSSTTRDDDGDDQTSSVRLLLGWPLFMSYGVGHVFNDMIASMWFAYALVYYISVISMHPSEAGYVLLVGQLTDAVATATIGIVSDNTENYFTARYGRRKTWHLFGSILVFASLPFAFSPPMISGIPRPLYYCFFIVFFQIGWACIENSHMALASDLTPSKSGRTALMSIRYSFTVFSNIFVYVITWSVLRCSGASEEQLKPAHCGQIQVVVLAIMIVGAIATIVFHIGVHEPLVNRIGNNREDRELLVTENESGSAGNRMMSTFKSLSLYQTAFVYMGSRILVNMTSVFLPLYLQNYLETKSEKLALLPLIMYLSSFGMSFFNQPMNMKIGRKCTYLFGVVMAICAAVWCFIGSNEPSFKDYQIYGVTTVVGIACSVILVTSQALTTDFIGNKTNRGAFIFGLMSFTDKVSNGIVIEVVQALDNNIKGDPYYRNIMIIIWTIPSCLAYIIIMSLPYGGRPSKEVSKRPKSNTSYESEKKLEAQPIMVENVHYT